MNNLLHRLLLSIHLLHKIHFIIIIIIIMKIITIPKIIVHPQNQSIQSIQSILPPNHHLLYPPFLLSSLHPLLLHLITTLFFHPFVYHHHLHIYVKSGETGQIGKESKRRGHGKNPSFHLPPSSPNLFILILIPRSIHNIGYPPYLHYHPYRHYHHHHHRHHSPHHHYHLLLYLEILYINSHHKKMNWARLIDC